MIAAGSSGPVSTGVNDEAERASVASQSSVPAPRAPATPITCSRRGRRWRTGSRLARVRQSAMATRAALLASRYSSASGPNWNESGTAIAPIWKQAR